MYFTILDSKNLNNNTYLSDTDFKYMSNEFICYYTSNELKKLYNKFNVYNVPELTEKIIELIIPKFEIGVLQLIFNHYYSICLIKEKNKYIRYFSGLKQYYKDWNSVRKIKPTKLNIKDLIN